MQSMTAYARVQQQIGENLIVWEIRSVNHRYLDVSWRLPESFRYLEPQLRTQVRQVLARGKVECQLKITYNIAGREGLVLNKERAIAILQAAETIHRDFDLTEDMTVSRLLQMPDILVEQSPDKDELEGDIISEFGTALAELQALRTEEGDAVVKMLQRRIEAIGDHIDGLQKQTGRMNKQLRSKLLTRLDTLGLGVDNQRVEQEIALLLQRMDVSEELDRIRAHCSQVEKLLMSTNPVGRKLDFLMQELNREANTLSAKSDDVGLTSHAVEIKVLIEQMREQIQNIE